MKVLPGYFMLLTLYIIEAAKLPDKIIVPTTTNAKRTPPTISKAKKNAVDKSTTTIATALRSTSTTELTTTTYIPTKTNSNVRKSPKKYTPTTQKSTSNGPLKISLSKSVKLPSSSSTSSSYEEDNLACPKEGEATFELFAPPCKTHRDCTSWNPSERCCHLFGSKNCIQGVPKPIVEQEHSPILGLIPQKCPERPLAELWWELKACKTDSDCWPRICCPDGRRQYCRNTAPHYEGVPPPIGRSIAYLSEYLECTPPPPPVFDLHPKQCNSTLDCFPNICCQESGQKHCRPPKKSVLTIMANFLNIGLVKRLTRNLVIK